MTLQKILIAVFFPAVAVFAWQCGNTPSSDMAPEDFFASIEGTWKMKDGYHFEQWKENGGSWSARAFKIMNADTLVIETVDIVRMGQDVYYRVDVAGQNDGKPVDFLLTSLTGKEIVFENPAHDFPQRIRYILKDDGDLLAEISSLDEDSPKTISFLYSKQ